MIDVESSKLRSQMYILEKFLGLFMHVFDKMRLVFVRDRSFYQSLTSVSDEVKQVIKVTRIKYLDIHEHGPGRLTLSRSRLYSIIPLIDKR